ncbi:hypothetical protein SSAG_03657 [Streptomyces sp. Mg1]|nr:hypothetical protein SSAG_03657 [Streptomyces sp. Mg1]
MYTSLSVCYIVHFCMFIMCIDILFCCFIFFFFFYRGIGRKL